MPAPYLQHLVVSTQRWWREVLCLENAWLSAVQGWLLFDKTEYCSQCAWIPVLWDVCFCHARKRRRGSAARDPSLLGADESWLWGHCRPLVIRRSNTLFPDDFRQVRRGDRAVFRLRGIA